MESFFEVVRLRGFKSVDVVPKKIVQIIIYKEHLFRRNSGKQYHDVTSRAFLNDLALLEIEKGSYL